MNSFFVLKVVFSETQINRKFAEESMIYSNDSRLQKKEILTHQEAFFFAQVQRSSTE